MTATTGTEVDRGIGRMQPVFVRAGIVCAGPGICLAIGIPDKQVIGFEMTAFVAIQELRERFLAGYEVVRSGETYAHFQRALAGDAVKVALGQNAECLAQVRK